MAPERNVTVVGPAVLMPRQEATVPPAPLAIPRWDQLVRQQVIPSPLGRPPVDSIDLKPPKLEADRKKEKSKKRIIMEWQRGLWLRRALLRSRDKAKEKSKDEHRSPTARGVWKIASVAIGLALSAPNRSILVPQRKRESIRRYGPV